VENKLQNCSRDKTDMKKRLKETISIFLPLSGGPGRPAKEQEHNIDYK
jgi:hypothetical protein